MGSSIENAPIGLITQDVKRLDVNSTKRWQVFDMECDSSLIRWQNRESTLPSGVKVLRRKWRQLAK
jgi:hypothetical protein